MGDWAGAVLVWNPGKRLLYASATLIVLGCGGGDVTTPTSGSLEITTITSGPEPDADGYAVTIDAGAEAGIALNGTHRRDDLEPGNYSVQLVGLAANCTVGGDNPRTVSVTAGATTTVEFTVICGPTTGSLTITVSTSGPSPDADGYGITVDGSDKGTLAASAEVTLTGLAPGNHQVGLSGIAANCQSEGDNPRTIGLTAGATGTAAFLITCVTPPPITGSLTITITTTGPAQDRDGYSFALDGGATQSIGLNATVTLANLAAGSHSIQLSDIAGNCLVDRDNPRSVEVSPGRTASITFSVSCSALPPSPILFTSNAVGLLAIFVVNPDGTGLRKLTDGQHPVWSPDKRKIAFFGEHGGISIMNADGSGKVDLPTQGNIGAFRWSPDGRMIAFEGDRSDVDQFDLWIMRADGSGQTLLAADAQGISWSPDGRKIAFHSVSNDGLHVWVVNSDGTRALRLTDGPQSNLEPVWSPDGSKIAFLRASEDFEIYVMNADGTGLINLTNGRGFDTGVQWSVDGRRILFASSPHDRSDSDIFVMNADGSSRTRLTSGPAIDGSAIWSPDGSQIAFSRLSGRDGEVYVMNADGSGQTNISNRPATSDAISDW
jgi:Tol biopolymer transport system component